MYIKLPLKHILLPFCICLLFSNTFAQDPPKNWHLLDQYKDGVAGISLQQAYSLLQSHKKTAQPLIVAVLDSGIDINHTSLAPNLWVNPKELPNNNKDDDNNGYIDDIHGWNFIGNPKGESLVGETLEITRMYKSYKARFGNKDKFSITPDQKTDYLFYLQLKRNFESAKEDLHKELDNITEEYSFFSQLVPPLQKRLKKKLFSKDELLDFTPKNPEEQKLKATYFNILSKNDGLTSEKLIAYYEQMKDNTEQIKKRLDYNYNLDFDGRKLVGDNMLDLQEKYYGNSDVTKRAEHGTHVAGIIGSLKNKEQQIEGIAPFVQIMAIRTTPLGDESDKDVANGIRYAVDNGAQIINMSFGKEYSPHKDIVDQAVKYAEEKGVLLIHGAGNASTNTDLYYNYPSALLEDGSIATNWIEVGASSIHNDEKKAANFSNYGKKSVDIFAPGVDIYATLPDNSFGKRSGTSMAAPVVTGIASILLGYFPALSPQEIKSIILESGIPYNNTVIIPGSDQKASFDSLSRTGKIANAYTAVQLAIKLQKEN